MQEKNDKKHGRGAKPQKPWLKYTEKWRDKTSGVVKIGAKAARYFYTVKADMEAEKERRVRSPEVFEEIFSNRLREEYKSIYEQLSA